MSTQRERKRNGSGTGDVVDVQARTPNGCVVRALVTIPGDLTVDDATVLVGAIERFKRDLMKGGVVECLG